MIKNLIISISILLLAASLYILTMRGEPGNALNIVEANRLTKVGQVFESSHERSPYASMIAITEGHINLAKDWANFSSPDVGYIKGKFYSFFPVGIPILMYPLYSIGSNYGLGIIAGFAVMPLVSIISILLLFLISRQVFRLPLWASVASGLIFAFATTSWSYAITIYQHAPTVTCMLLGFYTAWRYSKSTRWGSIWAILTGAIYGLAIFIDYPNALLMAPIMVYLVISGIHTYETESRWQFKLRSSALLGILVFGLISGIHLYYNQRVFGNPLQFHNPAPRYTPETFDQLLEKLNNTSSTTKPSNAVSIFSEFSLGRGLYELSVAPDKGIFFFSPILLFGLWGIIKLRSRFNLETAVFLSLAIINIFMYASFGDPWGGWAFGPRYLIPSMAILSVFTLIPLSTGKLLILKRLNAFLLIAYSSAVAIVGVVTTNLVPPKIEADYLHLKYNYLRNIDFLKSNTTGNYIYNTYLAQNLTLQEYAIIIYISVLVVFLVVFALLPLFDKKKPSITHV